METERIALSQRERDRLRVLHEVQQRHLTQVAAAARLKVTDRQVRRMLLRIREHVDAALVHGLRGRPSNRKLAARFEENRSFRAQRGRRHHREWKPGALFEGRDNSIRAAGLHHRRDGCLIFEHHPGAGRSCHWAFRHTGDPRRGARAQEVRSGRPPRRPLGGTTAARRRCLFLRDTPCGARLGLQALPNFCLDRDT